MHVRRHYGAEITVCATPSATLTRSRSPRAARGCAVRHAGYVSATKPRPTKTLSSALMEEVLVHMRNLDEIDGTETDVETTN